MSGKVSEYTQLKRDLKDLEAKYKRRGEALDQALNEREELKDEMKHLKSEIKYLATGER